MNLRRIKAIAKKEVIQVWRDPRSLMVVLLMPLMQMALLGYGVNLDIRNVTICTFDREGSQRSEALMKSFQAWPYFNIVETERDYTGVKQAIDAGRCKMAIVVPPDFSEDLASTNSASVQAILDATDDNTANIALGYAQGVVASFSSNIQLERTQSLGQPPPVSTTVAQYRVWFNEDLVSRDFIIPGVVALVLALVGAQLTSLTISREWERGNMEVLVSTPVTPMELMAGKILPYFFIGLIDAALCLLIAVYWFETPFRGAVSTLFLTTSLFLIVVLGLGYFISAGIRSQIAASRSPWLSPSCRRRCFRASPDAAFHPGDYLSGSRPLLFRDPEGNLPEGQRTFRSYRPHRLPCHLCCRRGAPGHPRLSQDPRVSECGRASRAWCSRSFCSSCAILRPASASSFLRSSR
jgi:ABC-2 type transport system permease protein